MRPFSMTNEEIKNEVESQLMSLLRGVRFSTTFVNQDDHEAVNQQLKVRLFLGYSSHLFVVEIDDWRMAQPFPNRAKLWDECTEGITVMAKKEYARVMSNGE